MKRGMLVLLLVLLAAMPFIAIAEENETSKALVAQDLIRNASFLDNNVQIPESMQIVSRIFLGVKSEDSLNVQKLIILMAIWLIVGLAIGDILHMFSVFSRTTSIFIGFGISTISGATKVNNLIASVFLSMGSIFGVVIKYQTIFTVLSIAILIALWIVIKGFLKHQYLEEKVIDAKIEGMNTGASMSAAEKLAKKIEESSTDED